MKISMIILNIQKTKNLKKIQTKYKMKYKIYNNLNQLDFQMLADK